MRAKRYTVVNKYIRGSNVGPQLLHGLNNLWKNWNTMEYKAQDLFSAWAYDSEVEIVLQGGGHAELERLYEHLANNADVPLAKFNESEEELCGACTIVTFVATDRMVALNNYIRTNRLPYDKDKVAERVKDLTKGDLKLKVEDSELGEPAELTIDEIYVSTYISRLPLVK